MPDAIDVEVIRHALSGMLAEAEANICQTAFSPVVYEVRDFCTALLDRDARFVAQGVGGVPIFLGDLDAPVRRVLEQRGEGMRPGDVYLTNEAAVCGQHLNNVVAVRPLYAGGELEALAAVRVHWLDVGGRAAGGWVSDTTDIHQEGLQLPGLLVEREGALRPEVLDLVAANVRFPEMVLGDLRAQVAATALLEQRFEELCERFGSATYAAAVARIWDDSERLAAAQMQRWTGGATVRASAALDDELRIEVAVEIADGRAIVDFGGTSAQSSRPVNSGHGARIAARIAYKCLTVPDRPADEGMFRALEIRVPGGTFLSCGAEAPMALWSAPLPVAVDTVLAAFARVVPDAVPAAHHGELGGFALYGTHPDSGERFYQIDTVTGGWGGGPAGRGRSALKSICHGDTYTTSVELEEQVLPVLVEGYRLRDGSGGAGRSPGGLGTERVYRIPTEMSLNLGLVRPALAPWGLDGGEPGAPSDAVIERPSAEPEVVTSGTALALPPGSRLRIRSGGGGGWGRPGG
jgi:N-methylhydantoinase B